MTGYIGWGVAAAIFIIALANNIRMRKSVNGIKGRAQKQAYDNTAYLLQEERENGYKQGYAAAKVEQRRKQDEYNARRRQRRKAKRENNTNTTKQTKK